MTKAIETQATIGEWLDGVAPAKDRETGMRSQALKCLNEAVELALECGATPAEIHNATFFPSRDGEPPREWHERRPDPDSVPSELADVVIVANVLAHRAGIDLAHEVSLKMRINRESRKWVANPDGSAQHVPSHETPMLEV